jgi:hypothetical protein
MILRCETAEVASRSSPIASGAMPQLLLLRASMRTMDVSPVSIEENVVTNRRWLLVIAAGVFALTVQGAPRVAVAAPAADDVISKYDSDKDQTLSLDEVKTAASAHFDKLNKDSDGTLEANEVKGVLGPKAFKAADQDNDGTLSKDEYLSLVEKLFKRADTDHDGTLNATELQSKSGRSLRRLID